jgi:hypothetical protein
MGFFPGRRVPRFADAVRRFKVLQSAVEPAQEAITTIVASFMENGFGRGNLRDVIPGRTQSASWTRDGFRPGPPSDVFGLDATSVGPPSLRANAMRSLKDYLLLVLALIALGLSTLAWKQYQELAALRAAALTNGERADWQKRIWAAQKRAQNLESQLAAARPGGSAAGTAAPSARGQTPGAASGNMMTGFASLMNRPEAVRLMAMREKAMLNARYAALFKKLALTPEKLAQFQSLLADQLSVPMDVLTAAGQQGIDPMQNPQEFRQLVQNAQTEIEDKIKAALDPASYAQYQNYVQTEPQRMVVNQLQQSLSYTDTQLTTAQADQLMQILADTSPVNGGGTAVAYVNRTGSGNSMIVAVGTPPPDGGGGFGGSLVTDEALTRAQSVLSTAQIQALREIQQQQQAAAQLRQQMMQNSGTSGAPPPLPIAGPPPPPGG